MTDLNTLFGLTGKVAVITGGTGILGSEISCALAELGCRVALLDKNEILADDIQDRLDACGTEYKVYGGDVLDSGSLNLVMENIIKHFGKVDILINGAGGNHPDATTSAEKLFFDIPTESFNWVVQLNLTGTVLPCQVFGKYFAEQNEGVILNISSMNAFRPLTRIPAYSAAKAAVSNFTQWLAVHMAQEYSTRIRVNAIAPGFFLTTQNRFLLTSESSGKLTARGQLIIDHTPAGRFGKPSNLIGTIVWLLSPSADFVTGIVVPVDGGFSAFSGI